MIKEPPVSFTPWTEWQVRNVVRNAHLPGVYLLAHREAGPPSHVDATARAIMYIGEVTDQSLMGRWQQFHRAAFEGKPGHTGGLLYRDNFEGQADTLYVASFVPEGLSRELRTLFIRYLSHKLIWEWSQKWGGAPVCNTR